MSHPKIVTGAGEPSPLFLRLLVYSAIICLFTWMLVLWGAAFLFGPPYTKIWQVIVAHAFSGHWGNAAAGLRLEMNFWFLLFQTMMQDLIAMLFLYPATVQGYHFLWRLPVIGPPLKNLHDAALEYKPYIAPYGVLGLMVFVFIPVMGMGPLVGTVLGYLLGLNPLVALGSITFANGVSAVMCLTATDKLNEINENFAFYLLVFVLGIAVLGTIFGFVSRSWQRKRAARREAARQQPEQ
jgi:uncharacterized membrane protein